MFKRELVLRPNCLLTRRPIYLLTGPRSIFYYRFPWKDLQNYLYQHGYKVFVFKLPFQSTSQRQDYLKSMLHQLNQSHIFCEPTTFLELQDLMDQIKMSTVTVLTDTPLVRPVGTPFELAMNYPVFDPVYKLHQAYLKLKNIKTPSASEVGLRAPEDIYNKILDHCVKLAEMDFYDLDLNIQS